MDKLTLRRPPLLAAKAGLFYGRGARAKAVARVVERVLSEIGFVVQETTSHTLTRYTSKLIRGMPYYPPLFIFILGEENWEDWGIKAKEDLKSSVVVFYIDSDKADFEELPAPPEFIIKYGKSMGVELALDSISVFHHIKDLFISQPVTYLPFTKRIPEAREPYRMISVSKCAMVFSSGQGYIESTYDLEVLSQEFEGVSHYFGLTREAPPEAKLPPLEYLLNRPFPDRFLGQTFSYRLLAPAESSLHMAAIEIPEESDERKKVIRFLFTSPISRGQRIKYVMAWSHPRIYSPHGEDTSGFQCVHDYENLHLAYLFVSARGTAKEIFEPHGEPILSIFNPLDIKIGELPGYSQLKLTGLEYSWQLSNLPHGTTLIIKWKRH